MLKSYIQNIEDVYPNVVRVYSKSFSLKENKKYHNIFKLNLVLLHKLSVTSWFKQTV